VAENQKVFPDCDAGFELVLKALLADYPASIIQCNDLFIKDKSLTLCGQERQLLTQRDDPISTVKIRRREVELVNVSLVHPSVIESYVVVMSKL